MRQLAVLGLGIMVLLGAHALPVAAHHSFAAEFDANRPVKLSGKVYKMEWINPHAWIHIEVVGSGGKVELWAIEGGAPNALLRRGFTKESLMPGTVISLEGYQAKDGSFRANGRNLMFADGRQLFMGSSGSGAPGDEKQ